MNYTAIIVISSIVGFIVLCVVISKIRNASQLNKERHNQFLKEEEQKRIDKDHKNQIQNYLINKEYNRLLSILKKDDINKNITTEEITKCVIQSDLLILEKLSYYCDMDLFYTYSFIGNRISSNKITEISNNGITFLLKIVEAINDNVDDTSVIAFREGCYSLRSNFCYGKQILYQQLTNIIEKLSDILVCRNLDPNVYDLISLNDLANKALRMSFSNYKDYITDKRIDEIKKELISKENELEEIKRRYEIQINKSKQEGISSFINLCATRAKYLDFMNQIERKNKEVEELISNLKNPSNISTIPYLASMIADLETAAMEKAANSLDWGSDQVRMKKVRSLRDLKKETRDQLEQANVSYYQLQYLLQLFPSLQDILDSEYDEIKFDLKDFDYKDQDPARSFLSKEEWDKLSETERNQLALDRYIESHSKNNWQIGRDYELYVGQQYQDKGYDVDFTGSYMGLEDMGRDLICKKNNNVLIIQCKYWGKDKEIHEKHINQLYGTMITYCIENNIPKKNVKGVFITNIRLSKTAYRFAKMLGIEFITDKKMNDFPRIKCNLGVDEYGKKVKIYHLPMDLSYDVAKICNKGEFYAYTVKEAEKAGFRRSYKWHGINDD